MSRIAPPPRVSTVWASFAALGISVMVLAGVIASLWRIPPGSTEIHGDLILLCLGLWATAWLASVALLPRLLPSPSGGHIAALFAVAGLARLALLFATPLFSDDIWRYLWEGKVQWHGFSPFALAPLAFSQTPMAIEDPFWIHINYPEISAIYPPLAQLVFALVAGICYSPIAMKVAMVLFDLAVAGMLLGMMRRRGMNPMWVIAWLWSPFVCFEVAGSGHLDAMAAFFVILWLDQWERRREVSASLALGLAIASKLIPIVLVPVALRWHRRRWTALLAPLLALLLYVPYLDWGTIRNPPAQTTLIQRLGLEGPTRALRSYETRWRHNDFLFWGVYESVVGISTAVASDEGESMLTRIAVFERAARGGEAIHRENPDALRVAKIICYAVFLIGLGFILWRARSLTSAALWTLGLFILLRPAIHPWYVLLVLPMALIERRSSWFVLSILTLFTYATVEEYLQTGEWHESMWAWGVQWMGFVVVLLAESVARTHGLARTDADCHGQAHRSN